MARNADFAKALKKFRRDLEQSINEKALRRGYETSYDVAERFVEFAKKNLDNAKPTPESQHLVDQIKDSIEVENFSMTGRTLSRRNGENPDKPRFQTGAVVRVPIDKDGLVMFLEYGTGLKGKREPHPESVDSKFDGFKVGWKYAVNLNNYKTVTLRDDKNKPTQVTQPCYITRNGKRGFVFKKRDASYIDKEDVLFKNEYTSQYRWVKGYTDKNGRVVKAFTRRNKNPRTYTSKTTYVLSTGITPVRFIYDAKQEIKYLFVNKMI